MAFSFQKDVLIACSCNSLNPITKIHFCRHCIAIRCSHCVNHEIETVYCTNCLGNLATSEAKLRKNRCNSCFDCPNCFHTLSTRVTTISHVTNQSNDPNQPVTKTSTKSYYLACCFCRWTSRDVKIPDQNTATSSNWPEHENVHASRISSLIEHYQVVALKEKSEKEKKLFHPTRRSYQHFSEKFGVTSSVARKRAGIPLGLGLTRDVDLSTIPEVAPSIASEQVEALPQDIFTKPVDIENTTSLEQRFMIPDLQGENKSQLFPLYKHLFVKRSLRCRNCMHNICKPEYTAHSIKFKIHLSAYYYVPEIKLMEKYNNLQAGNEHDVFIKLCNPSQSQTSVNFLHIDDVSYNIHEDTLITDLVIKNESDVDRNSSLYLSGLGCKKTFPSAKPFKLNVNINGDVQLPNDAIILPAKDDTAEYDDNTDNTQYEDNAEIVTWRKSNKVILKLKIKPDESLQCGDEVLIGFIMRYTYTDKQLSALQQKEEKSVHIHVRHYINVGLIS